MNNENKEMIPLLNTRGIFVFPGCSEQLDVGRVFSVNAITTSLSSFEGKIVLVSQRDPNGEEINKDTVFEYGTLCTISSIREKEKFFRIKVTGISRVKLVDPDFTLADDNDYYKTDFDVIESVVEADPKEEEQIMNKIIQILSSFGASTLPPSFVNRLQKGISSEELTNNLCQFFPFVLDDKERMLEETSIIKRLSFILEVFEQMKDANDIEMSINRRVRERTDKQQKEYI